MARRVVRMAAGLDEVGLGLVSDADLHEARLIRLLASKVRTRSALTVVNIDHERHSLQW